MTPILRLIPAPVHRLALRLADALRKRWWGVFHSRLVGCCVIARDPAGRVLLVRHSYGCRGWTLPTGGVGRDEDPALTAAREFLEETGCVLADPRLLAVLEGDYFGARHIQHVFAGEARGAPRPDGREVVALQFFPPDELPDELDRPSRRKLALLSE